MDKKIIDTLIKFGLITNIGVNADSYKDVDDLINKGVVTIPGAKTKIDELLKNLNLEISEPTKEIVDIVPNDTTTNVITAVITIEPENEVEDIKETEVETAIEVETKDEVIKSEVEDIKETEVIVEEPKSTTTKRTKKQNKTE